MTQEKKKWLTQTARVINRIVNDNKYSEKVIQVQVNDPLFIDSCNYVNLVSELREFCDTLQNMVKYAEMSEEQPEKK